MIRVLIADDQVLVRSGVSAIIGAQEDLEVVGEASDGEEAVRRALELDPDVMVMDIRMPVMDGHRSHPPAGRDTQPHPRAHDVRPRRA